MEKTYKLDLNQPVHVYFIGIGGVSMSGLAHILHDRGFPVSGSDRAPSEMTRSLEEMGVRVHYGQKAENLRDTAVPVDVAVYTAAVHPDNPEYMEAEAMGLPLLTRAELLGQLMKTYALPVAVAGTHGKTTTTGMLSKILLEADTDPTISIGGVFPEIGGNIRIGQSGFFVTEACEYTNSYLSFFPKISIVTGIDADHLDFFKDLSDIRQSFSRFMRLLPADGSLIVNGSIDHLSELTAHLPCRVLTYGEEDSFDYYISNTTYDDFGNPSFSLHRRADGSVQQISLRVPGQHNIMNATAAAACADLLGISRDCIAKALRMFTGTARRFEYKGEVGGVTVIDDYAHHPTEIRATLSAAARYPHKSLWCVFQPHTYTRTKALFDEFADALCLADHVILADIYAARETDDLGVSSRTLSEEISRRGHDSRYFPSFDEIEKFLLQNCTKGDLLITMGAGDVVKLGESLLGL